LRPDGKIDVRLEATATVGNGPFQTFHRYAQFQSFNRFATFKA
jgi:hypothetical protein